MTHLEPDVGNVHYAHDDGRTYDDYDDYDDDRDGLNTGENPDDLFELEDKLGEGSYGMVCKGIEKSTGDVYAIKFVDASGDDENMEDMEEIKREIDILHECNECSCIVRYFRCFFYDALLWVVMEYCQGGSVHDFMRVCKRSLTEVEVGAVIACIVEGLTYLHKRNILHRDVKASNVLLSRTEAKLADFGVSAQLSSTLQKRETLIGSPYWMAPEAIVRDEEGYDAKADIWSLGITTLEIAQGKPPHYGVHYSSVIFMIPKDPPPKPKDPSAWSDEFNDFVRVCLEKNPAERPTAEALMEHPFVVKGRANRKVIGEMVEESLPKLELERTPMAGDQFGDSLGSLGSMGSMALQSLLRGEMSGLVNDLDGVSFDDEP
eukprot:TRINITY_DN4638_c0_g1_i1.p1 TRINITY_DN4638_c0_g1~~TRINITY_DN4638_c0_g1_i1.p1  ORF type:complete len:376 (+),score=80.10 TRINITY_DN4638_c0_g1_i1:575-1702(+)